MFKLSGKNFKFIKFTQIKIRCFLLLRVPRLKSIKITRLEPFSPHFFTSGFHLKVKIELTKVNY